MYVVITTRIINDVVDIIPSYVLYSMHLQFNSIQFNSINLFIAEVVNVTYYLS